MDYMPLQYYPSSIVWNLSRIPALECSCNIQVVPVDSGLFSFVLKTFCHYCCRAFKMCERVKTSSFFVSLLLARRIYFSKSVKHSYIMFDSSFGCIAWFFFGAELKSMMNFHELRYIQDSDDTPIDIVFRKLIIVTAMCDFWRNSPIQTNYCYWSPIFPVLDFARCEPGGSFILVSDASALEFPMVLFFPRQNDTID